MIDQELKKKDALTATINAKISQADVDDIDASLARFDRKLLLQFMTHRYHSEVINGVSYQELFEAIDKWDFINHVCEHFRGRILEELRRTGVDDSELRPQPEGNL